MDNSRAKGKARQAVEAGRVFNAGEASARGSRRRA
jgi:hypothetical protein